MKNEGYKDNFEFTQDIETKLNIRVKLYVYTYNHCTNINGKWTYVSPDKRWYNIDDIIYFREQNESDSYNNNADWISEGTVMPTKWCMMVYSTNNGIKIIPAVGKAKELNQQLELLKDRYSKGKYRLNKLEDKIKDLYLFEELN